jgi:hypothetical protein
MRCPTQANPTRAKLSKQLPPVPRRAAPFKPPALPNTPPERDDKTHASTEARTENIHHESTLKPRAHTNGDHIKSPVPCDKPMKSRQRREVGELKVARQEEEQNVRRGNFSMWGQALIDQNRIAQLAAPASRMGEVSRACGLVLARESPL